MTSVPTYGVTPMVVSTGRTQTLRIGQALDAKRFEPGSSLVVEILERGNYRNREVVPATARAADGGLASVELQYRPERPGEYLIHLGVNGQRWPAPSALELSFFAVSPELASCRPYKGDMHMHTYHSDGIQSPLVMAARCREVGLDFAAITDHRHYQSSLEAIRRARELDFQILMIPGEECNYCIGLGHVLSYGAREGVSERLLTGSPFGSWKAVDNAESLQRLVDYAHQKVKDEVAEVELPPEVDRKVYAFYHWVVREVHRAGGVAVAAHPYWVSQRVVDLFSPVYEQVLRHRLVDGIELFGDVEFEDNMLSLSRYTEEARSGSSMPIWASSDSHDMGFPLLGRAFTVAFAPRLDTQAVFDAILSGRATACLGVDGSRFIVAGPPALVDYTYFLLRSYFPAHDRLCATTGGLYGMEARGFSVDPGLKGKLHEELLRECDRWFGEPGGSE